MATSTSEAGVKKAKAAKQAGSSATSGIDAFISLMVESISINSKETCKRSDSRWKSMMETQQEKLMLEREKVEATKLKDQATMRKAMNESTNIVLAKMKEEANILQADMSTIAKLRAN
jgi:hypothetical protein